MQTGMLYTPIDMPPLFHPPSIYPTHSELSCSHIHIFHPLFPTSKYTQQGNLRYIVPRFISEKGCVLWGTFFHGTSMAVMGGAFNVRACVWWVMSMCCGQVQRQTRPSPPTHSSFRPTQNTHPKQSWMMLAFYPPRLGAAVKIPGLMGLMANSVAMSDQGVLQGSIMSLRVLAKVRAFHFMWCLWRHVHGVQPFVESIYTPR